MFVNTYSNGSDRTCSDYSDSGCISISQALNAAAGSKPVRIELLEGVHESDVNGSVIGDMDVYIQGDSEEVGEVGVTYAVTDTLSEHVFTIKSGSLSLYSFAVVVYKQTFLVSSTLFFITSDGILNMTEMTLTSGEVENVTQLHYQSLLYIGSGHLICTNTSITSFTLSSTSLIFLNELCSDSLILSNFSISNITKNTGGGSIFRLTSFNERAVIDRIGFDSDTCLDGDGGAVYLSVPSGEEAELSSLSFTSCIASKKGGALFIELKDESSVIRFNNLSFTPPGSAVGVNIYIQCIDGIEASLNGNWPSLGSYEHLSEDSHCYWLQESTTSRSALNDSMVRFIYSLTDVTPSSDLIVVTISSSGADVRSCGWDDFPCLSISTAVSVTSPRDAKLLLTGSSHPADTHATVFDSERSINVTIQSSTSKHVTKVESESEGVFTILDATVSFESLPFILDDSSLLSSPLFYSSIGSLFLSNITIQPEIFAETLTLNSSLIVVSAECSVTFTLLRTLNVELSEMNGTVVNAELGQSNELSFTNCTFSSCKAVNGYGGVLYIHAPSSLTSLSFSNISFSTCNDLNTQHLSSNGNGLFISSSSVASITLYTHWNTLVTSQYSFNTEGLYTIEIDSCILPLYRFIFPPSANALSDVYTIPEDMSGILGGETESCGWSDFPCLTIHSASLHSYAPISTLSIHLLCNGSTHIQEYESTTFNRTTTVDSIEGTISKYVGSINSSSPIFLIQADVSFSDISFLLTSDSASSPVIDNNLFFVSSGLLTLHSIGMTCQSSISTNEQLILLSHSLIAVERGGSLNASKLSIERIHFSSGNGSAIFASLNSSCTFIISSESTFTHCSAEYGGAVYLQVESDPYSISLGNITFTDCTASSSFGMGLYVRAFDYTILSEKEYWIEVTGGSYEYGEGKETVWWGEYFIENDSACINASLLHLVYKQTESASEGMVYVSEHGCDVDTCGWIDLPCQTLYSALTHNSSSLTAFRLVEGNHSAETSIVMFKGELGYSVEGDPSTLSSVSKEVSSTFPDSSLFYSNCTSLSLSYLTFVFEASMNYTFIHVQSGQTLLRQLSFFSPTITASPILSVSSDASLTLDDGVEFTNLSVRLSGSFYLTHSVDLTNSSFSSSNVTSPFAFIFLSTFTSSHSSFIIQRDSSPLTITSCSFLLPPTVESPNLSSILSSSSSLTLSTVSFTGQDEDSESILCSYSLIIVTSGNLTLNTIHITSLYFIFSSPPIYLYSSSYSNSALITASITSLSFVNCSCSLSSGALFTAVSSTLSFTQCSINTTSLVSSYSSESLSYTSESLSYTTDSISEESGCVCNWNSSLILMRGCSAYVSECTFNDTGDGVMSIEDSTTLTLTNSSFHLSSSSLPPSSSSTSSIQHNILCTSSSLTMNGYNDATITPSTSLWISESGCTFTTDEETPISLLFVPILSSVVADEDEEGEGNAGMYTLTFRGTDLINCSLFFILSSSDGEKITSTPIPFDSFSLDSSTTTATLHLSSLLLSHTSLYAQLCLLTSPSESEGDGRYIVLQRGVMVEGVGVSGGSVTKGEGESGAVHSTLSPQMIVGVGVPSLVTVAVIISLCVCCIVSKKGKQRENTQAELTRELMTYDSTHSSDDSNEDDLTQPPSPSNSMYRFMDSQEQEANSYTKYDNQKPYLE